MGHSDETTGPLALCRSRWRHAVWRGERIEKPRRTPHRGQWWREFYRGVRVARVRASAMLRALHVE